MRVFFDEKRFGKKYGYYECYRCDGWHTYTEKG